MMHLPQSSCSLGKSTWCVDLFSLAFFTAAKGPTRPSYMLFPRLHKPCCTSRQKLDQARLREEVQIRTEHANHLKIMRQKLEAEKKQRNEDALKLRRQLETKQVPIFQPAYSFSIREIACSP